MNSSHDPIANRICDSVYDIVIVGASVAGCACALAIRQQLPHLSIVVVERNTTTIDPNKPRIGETLPGHVCIPLQQLGLWPDFLRQNYLAAHGTCSVWGNEQLQVNEFISSPYGHGWHLDRNHFDQWLRQQLLDTGITIIDNHRLVSRQKTAMGWQLGLTDRQISCRFVVDASGRNASFATSQGVKKTSADQLVGLYRYYQAPQAFADSNALIESQPNGWWYSALLPNNQLVVALMTDADIASQQQLQRVENWQAWLAQTNNTQARLTQATPLAAPVLVPAQSQCLNQLAGDGWLATGDAAFTFDPLSSLGIFKALRMGLYSAYAIKDYWQQKDLRLQKYQQVAASEYHHYLDKRQQYYLEEQRYAQQPFWQRRHRSTVNQVTTHHQQVTPQTCGELP